MAKKKVAKKIVLSREKKLVDYLPLVAGEVLNCYVKAVPAKYTDIAEHLETVFEGSWPPSRVKSYLSGTKDQDGVNRRSMHILVFNEICKFVKAEPDVVLLEVMKKEIPRFKDSKLEEFVDVFMKMSNAKVTAGDLVPSAIAGR